jgi:4-diphosphocytidyl-2C-methyl-D-erythritol kinase
MQGSMPNQLTSAALSVEPRLREFASSLGPSWQMTGSGSAYFCHCTDEQSARNVTTELKCWTAVAEAIGPWGE